MVDAAEYAMYDTPMYDDNGVDGNLVTRFEKTIPHSKSANIFEAEVDTSQPRQDKRVS